MILNDEQRNDVLRRVINLGEIPSKEDIFNLNDTLNSYKATTKDLKEIGPCKKHPKACLRYQPSWTEAEHGPPLEETESGVGIWCMACEDIRLERAAALREAAKLAKNHSESDDGIFYVDNIHKALKLLSKSILALSSSDRTALDAALRKEYERGVADANRKCIDCGQLEHKGNEICPARDEYYG